MFRLCGCSDCVDVQTLWMIRLCGFSDCGCSFCGCSDNGCSDFVDFQTVDVHSVDVQTMDVQTVDVQTVWMHRLIDTFAVPIFKEQVFSLSSYVARLIGDMMMCKRKVKPTWEVKSCTSTFFKWNIFTITHNCTVTKPIIWHLCSANNLGLVFRN